MDEVEGRMQRVAISLAIVLSLRSSHGFAQQGCPASRFVVDGPLLGAMATPDAIMLSDVLSDQNTGQAFRLASRYGCGPARVKIRPGASGSSVRATWNACGTHTRVRLRARIDGGCQTMQGTLNARGERHQAFSAHRADCNTVADDSAVGAFILDCATSAGYYVDSRVTPNGGSPTLRILGIYESLSGQPGGPHLTGEATVTVDTTAPTVLVVSSYESTHWTFDVVHVGSFTPLERVIANGYYSQPVTAPAGVIVENYNPVDAPWLGDIAYQAGNADVLVAGAEWATGLCVESFDGCYRANTFVVGSP
jgi:hypothetical protein